MTIKDNDQFGSVIEQYEYQVDWVSKPRTPVAKEAFEETIQQRAENGWRYVEYITTEAGSPGLVFERTTANDEETDR